MPLRIQRDSFRIRNGRSPRSTATKARGDAAAIRNAMDELRELSVAPASYISESSYFEREWQESYSGTNYSRPPAAKTNTILTGCSLFIMASEARTGVLTALTG
jgi:hypothetical protein